MRYEGYTTASGLPFKQGQKIVIPAGVTVRTTGPRGSYVTKRRQTVVVKSLGSGQSIPYRDALGDRHYRDTLEKRGFDFAPLEKAKAENSKEWYDGFVPFTDPSVFWIGAGYYWCHVDINELLAANELEAA